MIAALKEVWTFGLKHVFLVMDKCEGGELFDAIVARQAFSLFQIYHRKFKQFRVSLLSVSFVDINGSIKC